VVRAVGYLFIAITNKACLERAKRSEARSDQPSRTPIPRTLASVINDVASYREASLTVKDSLTHEQSRLFLLVSSQDVEHGSYGSPWLFSTDGNQQFILL
jgi:hypothetical protein